MPKTAGHTVQAQGFETEQILWGEGFLPKKTLNPKPGVTFCRFDRSFGPCDRCFSVGQHHAHSRASGPAHASRQKPLNTLLTWLWIMAPGALMPGRLTMSSSYSILFIVGQLG